LVTQIFLDFWEARVMVDQNDVAGAPAPAMLSAKRGLDPGAQPRPLGRRDARAAALGGIHQRHGGAARQTNR
jgi:hypothetical protein